MEEAIRVHRQAGAELDAASVVANLVVDQALLGKIARALTLAEDEIAALLRIRTPLAEARSEVELRTLDRRLGELEVWKGGAYIELGRNEEAVPVLEGALRRLRAAGGDPEIAAIAVGNLGLALTGLGKTDAAEAAYLLALDGFESTGNDRLVAQALSNLSLLLLETGKPKAAMQHARAAVQRMSRVDDPLFLVFAVGGLALAEFGAGDLASSEANYRDCIARCERMGLRSLALKNRMGLATVLLRRDKTAQALEVSRRALESTSGVLGGLGESEGISMRLTLSDLFTTGTTAAYRERDAGSVVMFADAAQATGLAEAMGGRSTLWSAVLPPLLVAAEQDARRDEQAARVALTSPVREEGRESPTLTTLNERHSLAWQRLLSVVDRIHREASSAGDIMYPRLMEPARVFESLSGEEALVLFTLVLRKVEPGQESSGKDLVAAVIHRSTIRTENLGPWDSIVRVLDKKWRDAAPDPAVADLSELSRALIEPLGLPDSARTVLVSPVAQLVDVPFPAILGARNVALIPSAGVLRVLRAGNATRGAGVLALGGVNYGTESIAGPLADLRRSYGFTSLSASRDEALSVTADPLLGGDATEAGLRSRLRSHGRWRSIHFACHGLFDSRRPLLSLLALTPQGEDDGLLFGSEILRLRCPSDLVVLSACSSSRSVDSAGEGALGLVRTFFHAGASRVIGNLWDADDAATAVLMKRFYELWNPTDASQARPACQALREAQQFVASHKKWTSPKYWAGWVLWGLPD